MRLPSAVLVGCSVLSLGCRAASVSSRDVKTCGSASYDTQMYKCYGGDQLCPIISGTASKPCGQSCYLDSDYVCYNEMLCPATDTLPMQLCGDGCFSAANYSCANGKLLDWPDSLFDSEADSSTLVPSLHLTSGAYDNYFFANEQLSGLLMVTSPLPESNLTWTAPRLLFGFPSGNSGMAAYFTPSNGVNGTLSMRALNSSIGSPLGPIYEPAKDPSFNPNPVFGLSAEVELNSSARINVAILGSIRTVRDFTEGPSLLNDDIQSALRYSATDDGGLSITRLWLDNKTSSKLTMTPTGQGKISVDNTTVHVDAGTYIVNATLNYGSRTRGVSPQSIFNEGAQDLVEQASTKQQADSVAFLSYHDKLAAGSWRFLTYFGRDSMISALLMEPILSRGQGGAMETVLAAVLERINRTDGSVCHEETIGDYATFLNWENEMVRSSANRGDWSMTDTDWYLPVLLQNYFVKDPIGRDRAADFFATPASFYSWDAGRNVTYQDMALSNAERIISLAKSFAGPGNQTKDNLVHLKDGYITGSWRDSTNGIGGGRIPFDVNTGLVPAGLRAVAALAKAGFFPGKEAWATEANDYATVWENSSIAFFEVSVPEAKAKSLVRSYAQSTTPGSYQGPSHDGDIDGDVTYYALSLEGYSDQSKVEVMNSDACFRLFFVNDTNDDVLTPFINNTAKAVMWQFPAGLMTPVGMLVANPAYGENPVYAANWTHIDYHGTVVWSFQLTMMAKGLERQLSRCSDGSQAPAFCSDKVVHCNALTAYNTLWDAIEKNKAHLDSEVWSWTYSNATGIQYSALADLSPGPGVQPIESDIIQLWSLTFLAVHRNMDLGSSC